MSVRSVQRLFATYVGREPQGGAGALPAPGRRRGHRRRRGRRPRRAWPPRWAGSTRRTSAATSGPSSACRRRPTSSVPGALRVTVTPTGPPPTGCRPPPVPHTARPRRRPGRAARRRPQHAGGWVYGSRSRSSRAWPGAEPRAGRQRQTGAAPRRRPARGTAPAGQPAPQHQPAGAARHLASPAARGRSAADQRVAPRRAAAAGPARRRLGRRAGAQAASCSTTGPDSVDRARRRPSAGGRVGLGPQPADPQPAPDALAQRARP